MDLVNTSSLIITAIAALAALVALFYSRAASTAAQSQAASAREQTRIQRQLQIDAAQPYVWVDIRPSDEHGQLLMLYVGNSGPTVATDVRVTFDPPLQFPSKPSRHEEAVAQLARGIRSLPPGRTMQWHLGVSHEQIPSAEPDGYHVQITASGPFGPLEPLDYWLDVRAFHWTLATAPGTLHGIAASIDKLTKATHDSRGAR